MADDLVKEYGSWLLMIVVLGSFVDLIQFGWIIKRNIRNWRRKLYNKVKRQVLFDQFEKGKKK